jgi:hypothetical protein
MMSYVKVLNIVSYKNIGKDYVDKIQSGRTGPYASGSYAHRATLFGSTFDTFCRQKKQNANEKRVQGTSDFHEHNNIILLQFSQQLGPSFHML